MCGICGIWKFGNITDEDKDLVRLMNKEQAHRGPDDEGIYYNANVVLGHRRLSIIDLTSAGHQPLCYKDRFWISFNGEIFNYIELREELKKNGYCFDTNSDTEVICAAYDFYGENCFEKFNGFWAMAIYDIRKQKLCLSRDRYGIKPLYYCKIGNKLVFASEIKAILCDSEIERKVNKKVIADFLIYGVSDHTEETFFKNIYTFPVASCAVITKEDNWRFQEYYRLKVNYDLGKKGAETDFKRFRKIFYNSIKLRLRSDVEIAACLSGGLDSSAIVCAVNRIYKKRKKNIKTFSAHFSGFKLDESEYIDEVLKYACISGEKVSPGAEEFWKDLDKLIYLQDQPFSSASAYVGYYLMKQVNNNGIKVILDGQGADEILCGYRKSRIYFIKKLIKNKRYFSALKEGICSINQFATSNNFALDIIKITGILFGKNKSSNPYVNKTYLETNYDYAKDDFIYNDIRKISLPCILRTVDRNSMAFSIEDRLPFLDYNLVDFALGLPLQSKIKDGWSKYIMRKSLELPEKIKYRKTKIGFVPPEAEWLQELNTEIQKVFLNKKFRSGEYVNRDAILRDWDKIIANPVEIPLFRFLCLEKWMQIYNVTS